MLYGHIETAEERVDHMLRARALQDETGGFQAFIPLAFHPDNNQMRKLPAPSATDTLRVHAVARLMLDNIPHIKAFWIATGVEVAQTGAVVRRRRPRRHRAGRDASTTWPASRTPEAMTTAAIRRLIRAAGREPVERDTLYNVVIGPGAADDAGRSHGRGSRRRSSSAGRALADQPALDASFERSSRAVATELSRASSVRAWTSSC